MRGMNTLLAVVVMMVVPFEVNDIEDVKPRGTLDRAQLKGKAPWCTGPFLGEPGWDRGRLRRTVSGGTQFVVAAIQLCESPDDPTWQNAARVVLQKWINECGCTQPEAEQQIVKAIAKWKKDKDNEGKEPSDEDRFAFGESDFNVVQPEPGVEAVKPGPLAWCDGVDVSERWDARRIARTVGNQYGIEGTIEGAAHLCWRRDDATWQQEGAYVLQKWMNWTRQSKAEAERSLKARVKADAFKAQREALCRALELSPEISGAEKAFGEARRVFFACSTRDNQALWQENAYVDDLGFYMDPLGEPPSEVVRLVWLFNALDNPWGRELPSKDAMENASLLEFAVAQRDLQQFSQAALDKELSAEPYNDYARVLANELVARMKGMQKVYEAAIDKVTKGDADAADLFKAAPRKGASDWEKVASQWKAEIARSNAFELKLGQPSRKALKGCSAELRGDVGKVIKGYKLTDYKALVGKISTDPIANLLMSRLAVCAAAENVGGLSGALADLVQKGRGLRGPRSMTYYAVVDALAAALKDRPRMVFSLSTFTYRQPSLAQLYGREFNFSGSIPYDPEDTYAKGSVASSAKVPEGVQINFKHSSYTYPEANCVDDKFHPLKIESNGTISYAQNCKYTGRMLKVDTTPRPIIVAPELTTNVKPGVYVVGQEFTERGKNGTVMGTVHFTKKSPTEKKIDTFYGFDL